jgi:hypothetical protein
MAFRGPSIAWGGKSFDEMGGDVEAIFIDSPDPG